MTEPPRFRIEGSRWVAIGHPRVSMPLERLARLRSAPREAARHPEWVWGRRGWTIRWPTLSYEITEDQLASLVARFVVIDMSRRRLRPGGGSLDWDQLGREAPRVEARWRDALQGAPRPFALCGGLAVNVYARPRFTDDLDLVVLSAGAEAWARYLAGAGWAVHGRLSTGGTAYVRDGAELDVLVPDYPWLPRAMAAAQDNVHEGIPVMPRAWLVLMKLTAGRSADQSDVSHMLSGLADGDFQSLLQTIETWLSPEDREDLAALYQLGRWERNRP